MYAPNHKPSAVLTFARKTPMRTAVLHAPHDLRIEDQPVPTPQAGEVRVRIVRGGICGSDLHYYSHGGFGTVRLREPMILGHEIVGRVDALGPGVTAPAAGTVVAVNPASPCGHCEYCLAGQPIHCVDMRFLGSAMRTPHVQGGFADYLICRAANAVPLPGGDVAAGAFAEPLAVCLHAVGQVPVYGRRVLVMGAGPIGALIVVAARFAGAREIVVVDVKDEPLTYARKVGADRTINIAARPGDMAMYESGKGHFDVVFEAAGQGSTVASALEYARPRGAIVLVGQGATAELPISRIVVKEIRLLGSFRFDTEFALAADLIGNRRVDVTPLLSETLPIADVVRAFDLAADKSKSMKVQLDFA
jgi:L-idonate 5-dehydrogenase